MSTSLRVNTVGELRDKLASLPDNMPVDIYSGCRETEVDASFGVVRGERNGFDCDVFQVYVDD